jgi:hypothetical protein
MHVHGTMQGIYKEKTKDYYVNVCFIYDQEHTKVLNFSHSNL